MLFFLVILRFYYIHFSFFFLLFFFIFIFLDSVYNKKNIYILIQSINLLVLIFVLNDAVKKERERNRKECARKKDEKLNFQFLI